MYIIENCSIKKIKESGQCFRILELSNDCYLVLSKDKVCKVTQSGYSIIVDCEPCDNQYWLYYFDESVYGNKEVDYMAFETKCRFDDSQFIRESVVFGHGLRVLNQDPFECLISFIISQRKSIPAISDCIEKLCLKYGDVRYFDGIEYHTFPTPEQLISGYEIDNYVNCSLGYRDEYVYRASKEVLENKSALDYLRMYPYDEALGHLKDLKGVGDKVANCTLLYSLGFKDAFPRDVWVNRILDTYFPNNSFPFEKYKGLLGVLQLYMFYYMRYK